MKSTYSSFDLPSEHSPSEQPGNGEVHFQSVPLDEFLKIYQEISGRVVIHGILPAVRITLHCPYSLGRIGTLQMFDSVLDLHLVFF
jgi:hypothetical protein